ncbi:hypothetical protein HWV62_39389 [Athelia sp. TMB]|nr:hypothetical protein HWV62_39389 [Athelia sp. TMB]
MENVLVNDISKLDLSATDAHGPNSHQLCDIEPLPSGARRTRRIFYYGWVISPEFLLEYAPSPKITLRSYSDGLDGLRKISRYKHLHWVNGYVADGEDLPHMDVGMEGRKVSDLLVVTASFTGKKTDKHLHNRRPTVAQMAKLIELFHGEKPSWHMDGQPKDFVHEYTLLMDLDD